MITLVVQKQSYQKKDSCNGYPLIIFVGQ